ncbi:MAG: NADH-quinone oxidoreductase subunit N [Paludibacter sp.]|nr:NADH-quinone oxidoreductase subunit N [Paludibacter sp.]
MYAIITISIVAIIVLFLGAIQKKTPLLPIIFVGLPVAFIINLLGWNQSIHYYNEMYIADNFSIAFNAVLIFTTLLVFIFAPVYYKPVKRPLEDIYALILFALIGALTMTGFGNILMLFVGIETMSLSLYILAGSKKFDPNSNEAAMKYFLTGSFASGFLLFGIALIYGACGSMNLETIKEFVVAHHNNIPAMLNIGLLLVAIGMTFKIGAAPFHFWAPDVYEGSPTLITTFMATVGKVAAIAAFFRLMSSSFSDMESSWVVTLTIFAIATILIGNLSAFYQDNVKRMFAYSGIAHAGYMLIAIIALKQQAAGVLLLYSISYTIATITAFAVLILVREETGTFSINAFKGLAKHNPTEAFAMTIAMLSLAGIPPLVGFAAKYNLFIAAIEQGHLPLVIVAIVGSMISVYYYIRPVVAMYFNLPSATSAIDSSSNYKKQIFLAAFLMIVLGLIPGVIINLI